MNISILRLFVLAGNATVPLADSGALWQIIRGILYSVLHQNALGLFLQSESIFLYISIFMHLRVDSWNVKGKQMVLLTFAKT